MDVALQPGQTRVDGYYTLASSSISFEHMPHDSSRKLPRHPIPVVLLARLAVDQNSRRQGLGEALLLDALRRSLRLGDELGIHAIEVDALDNDALSFYTRYGFLSLLDQPPPSVPPYGHRPTGSRWITNGPLMPPIAIV